MSFNPSRGFLISPFSAASERMAYSLVRSIRRYNPNVPVRVLAQDYVCGLDWRGMAEVRSVRAAEAHGTIYQWFNKLAVLLRSLFQETVYLDCDIVFLSDPADWFDLLGTDDFTYFQCPRAVENTPDRMIFNVVNPHRMREEFSVSSVPVIDGGGHFFLRRTERGRDLIEKVMVLMADALENGEKSLYGRMAGPGNIEASDELAASIVAVRENIQLPRWFPPPHKQMGIWLPPEQRSGVFNLEQGLVRYYDEWQKGEVTPRAIHFCYIGKNNPAYQEWIENCIASQLAAKLTSPGSLQSV